MSENNFETDKPPLSEDTPTFNFTPEEIQKMKEKGMTDDEIEKKRRDILNKIAREESTKY